MCWLPTLWLRALGFYSFPFQLGMVVCLGYNNILRDRESKSAAFELARVLLVKARVQVLSLKEKKKLKTKTLQIKL